MVVFAAPARAQGCNGYVCQGDVNTACTSDAQCLNGSGPCVPEGLNGTCAQDLPMACNTDNDCYTKNCKGAATYTPCETLEDCAGEFVCTTGGATCEPSKTGACRGAFISAGTCVSRVCTNPGAPPIGRCRSNDDCDVYEQNGPCIQTNVGPCEADLTTFSGPCLGLEPPPCAQGACPEPNAPPTCTEGGFEVTFVGYTPAPPSLSGGATYTYKICSPPAGTCVSTVRPGESCLHNSFCQTQGPNSDPSAYCTRPCAADVFRELSHFDVDFPSYNTCIGAPGDPTQPVTVMGTCSCTGGVGCSVDAAVVIGDGSCFESCSTVAKCDNTNLPVGGCITMTLDIFGETNVLGVGNAVVVDKESTTCTLSCMPGPVCKPAEDCTNGIDDECDGFVDCEDSDCFAHPDCQTNAGACLTRTLGFWGTHPWITNNYAPVTICGHPVGCSGPDNGESNPSCLAGSCDSIMEGLGSNGGELKGNAAYVSMLKQLTAAKLNLSATAALIDGGECSGFSYDDPKGEAKSIAAWISACETLCGSSQSKISGSGCIEALDAFNNSEDLGWASPPAPFDRPPVDDHGNISGADPSNFTAAHSNKVVIGKKVPGGTNCE